jgi:hypothetical protein
MWDDLVRNLEHYPTAVLTVSDAGGYPFSIRCVPKPDSARQVLEVRIPAYIDALAGPAGLLCHFHDDVLWKQTNFVAHGELEPDGGGWIFRPTRLIDGAGAGNPLLPQMRFRSSAKRYIDRHGMDWPQVPWARLRAIYRDARHPGER